ncbi:MAG TPA: hypothetical protein VFG43_01240 [Geminicoccaceae bacterium]|nr:hypothetical protein [Geminicoccaceae bacterium]
MADYQTTDRRDSVTGTTTGTGTTNPSGAQKVGVYDQIRGGTRSGTGKWIIWGLVALAIILALVWWFGGGGTTTDTTTTAPVTGTTTTAPATDTTPGTTVAPADQPPPTTGPAPAPAQ